MKLIHTDDFIKHLKRLPVSTKQALSRQELRFKDNPRHPSLHTKKLKDLDDVYSIRIGRSYRILFFFQNSNTVVFFAIGHRKDIYK